MDIYVVFSYDLELSKARILKVDRQISLFFFFSRCTYSFNYMMIAPRQVALMLILLLK